MPHAVYGRLLTQTNSDTHYFPFPLGPDRVEFVLNEEFRLFTA